MVPARKLARHPPVPRQHRSATIQLPDPAPPRNPSPHVPIRLESTGIFDHAGIFYVDVRTAPALLVLQQALIAATTPCGFVPEARAYHPHITLARSKGNDATQSLRQLKARIDREPKFTAFMADEFLLYESFTEPTGSRYQIRERFRLGPPLSG